MSKEKINIGETSKPRFEFRSFGQNFEEVRHRMSRLSVPVPEKVWKRVSEEIYIISSTNDINNAKYRDGKMDIKSLVQTIDGLEQWNPLMKVEFPITSEKIKQDIFPAFNVKTPIIERVSYTFDEFMEIIKINPYLLPVRVKKERYGYMVNNTICEFGYVWINGARVCTVSSESTDIEDIKKTLKDLRLEEAENINYLQAIKRVTGMSSRPLANE